MSVVAPDLRGKIYRERRLMQPAETTEFLRRQKVANVGTVDVNGWPYVVPWSTSTKAATCCTFTQAITKATSSQM